MSKPRLFIGSAGEDADMAIAAQTCLERAVEVTVWTQGVFEPAKFYLEALIDEMRRTEFALFVFSPQDIATIRDVSQPVVRDNVVFELGLFVGGLGRERNFILLPRDIDFHLPSDLLGITPATYGTRSDGRWEAALGPPCHQILRAIQKLHSAPRPAAAGRPIANAADCIALIQDWMGQRSLKENTSAISFDAVDRQLGLQPGSARDHIEDAAKKWGFVTERKGEQFVVFRHLTDAAFVGSGRSRNAAGATE